VPIHSRSASASREEMSSLCSAPPITSMMVTFVKAIVCSEGACRQAEKKLQLQR